VSELIPYFYSWKGFEVCGVLDDMYVAKKCNAHGQVYGYVRFSNVRDVNKLSKALNDGWFGQFRIWEKVARFDRFASSDVRKGVSETSGGRQMREIWRVREKK